MTQLRTNRKSRAFTLIELIVVMMLLVVVAAIAAPRLGGFMAGRNAEEECRRFIALTQFAGEEAISRGERLELWMNPTSASYGLRSTVATGKEVINFQCMDKLNLTVEEQYLGEDGSAAILFWPDGTIDESSPATIYLTESGATIFTMSLQKNRVRYAVQGAGNG
jgi:type II secretion system protein H